MAKLQEDKKIVHVFCYSQIVRTDEQTAVINFARETKLPASDIVKIAKQEEQEDGIIYQYKTGKIDSAKFRLVTNEIFTREGGEPLGTEIFNNYWKSMCNPNAEDFKKLCKLQNDHKFTLHIIAGTNELHHNYIQDKIKLFGSVPTITYTLSFEEHTADREKLEQLVKNYYSEAYQITFHNEQSPKDAVSILADIYELDNDASLNV